MAEFGIPEMTKKKESVRISATLHKWAGHVAVHDGVPLSEAIERILRPVLRERWEQIRKEEEEDDGEDGEDGRPRNGRVKP